MATPAAPPPSNCGPTWPPHCWTPTAQETSTRCPAFLQLHCLPCLPSAAAVLCLDNSAGLKHGSEGIQHALNLYSTHPLLQAIMELGATVCVPNAPPACSACPISAACAAHAAVREYEAGGGDPNAPGAPKVTDYPLKVCGQIKISLLSHP